MNVAAIIRRSVGNVADPEPISSSRVAEFAWRLFGDGPNNKEHETQFLR